MGCLYEVEVDGSVGGAVLGFAFAAMSRWGVGMCATRRLILKRERGEDDAVDDAGVTGELYKATGEDLECDDEPEVLGDAVKTSSWSLGRLGCSAEGASVRDISGCA